MFQPNALGANTSFGGTHTQASANVVKDFEVVSPPEDSVSSLAFSPAALQQNFLVAGSWDNNVRCWEVEQTGSTNPKAMQSCDGPVLDVCWTDDGTKVMMASCDKQVKCWDLASNQTIQVAQHDAPVRTCHWIKSPAYSCLMTGSWDKTLKFWDMRSANPMMSIQLPERCYGAAVDYPMAVVITASKQVIIYQLEGKPQEFRQADTNLKHQHRCVAIMRDKKGSPTGYAVGSVEGRVAIQYINAASPKDNFTFKCQRINGPNNSYQEIYAVNDIAFHPLHNTVATCGSDGTYHFWDKDARTKLKSSEQFDQPITRCCFNHNGQIFAYALSYDWHKGHEYYNPQKKNCIFLHPCYEDAKPRTQATS